MNQESDKPKYIIVLGTTYSGSGAVYDYLAGRGDMYDPLDGAEYLLPQSPGGLMALEAASGDAFHHAMSDYAVIQFTKLAQKLARSPRRSPYGKAYSSYVPEFLNEIEHFLLEITVAKMPMSLEWHNMMEHSAIRIIGRLKARLGIHSNPMATHVICSQDDLVHAATKMHDRLFHSSSKKPVLLNQAGSGWNPVHSTKYFEERKVVLVTRDPRDQFAELKQFKKAQDVEEFIEWFRALQQRIAAVEESVVMKLPFERFVCNNKASVTSLCDHFRLDAAAPSSYEASLSEKNIGKYKRWLTPHEIERIEADLLR